MQIEENNKNSKDLTTVGLTYNFKSFNIAFFIVENQGLFGNAAFY